MIVDAVAVAAKFVGYLLILGVGFGIVASTGLTILVVTFHFVEKLEGRLRNRW